MIERHTSSVSVAAGGISEFRGMRALNPDTTVESTKQEGSSLPETRSQASQQGGEAQDLRSSPSFGCRRLETSTNRTVPPTSAECNPSETHAPPSAGGQRELVLRLLRERGSAGLSSLEALRFAIMRLPNRVCELRAQGFQIASRSEPNGCRRYFLRSEPRDPKPLPTYAERSRQLEAAALPLFEGVGR